MYNNKNTALPSKELADCIRIWNSANISLIDLRHNLISPKEPLCNYRLPASSFVYTGGAKAEVMLDNTSYAVERFGLFHAGKGTELSIHPVTGWLEYYMVLYKAGEPSFHKREFLRLIENTNPFRQQYGFAPQGPLFFMEQLSKMYERCKGPTPLNLFYGKMAFYQLVYEVYEALAREKVHVIEPDVVTMACRYLDAHYGDETSIQELCGMLGISYSSFYRNFKQKTRVTPQEYLIRTRLAAAIEWLETSNASIREVAEHCGFPDEHNFYRQFIKSVGMPPNAYRQISHTRLKDNTIGNVIPFPYNWGSRVSLDKLKEKGETYMFKQMHSKSVVAASLSLMLLMSACGTVPVNSNGVGSNPTAAVTSQATENNEAKPVEDKTRTISTVMGDVEVPTNPQRVISDWGMLGNILSVGVTPIAIGDYGAEDVAYKDLIKDCFVLAQWEPEDIMAQEPDLIITCQKDNYEQISQIAPTIYIPSDELTLDERMALIAEALGKGVEQGAAAVTVFNEKVAAAKANLSDAGLYDKTFSVIRVQGENKIGVRWSNNLGGQILFGALKLPQTPGAIKKIEAGEDWGTTLSFESLPEYMGDYILVDVSDNYGYELIENNPVWQSLPAVQAGNIIILSESYMYLNDLYSWSAQLDLVTEELLRLKP